MTFALDLSRFAEKTKERADDVVGAVVVNIASRIDERSPVGDPTYWKEPPPPGYVGGHFRANWHLSIGAPDLSVIAGVDPTGEATQGRIIAAVPDEAAGHVYYLQNNLPYARRLEEGWSRQAPAGMVGLTVVEFGQVVNQAVEQTP